MNRTKREKAAFVEGTLARLYPHPAVPLDHSDAFTLLVAVVLSAQCTDKKVNEITPLLFQRASTPQAMMRLEVEEIREIIKPCGLSPMKSKGIHGLSRMIVEQHDGEVPADMAALEEALEAMPSVGHKTASVVMAQAFGIPAFPVDTHIHRLAYRWTLSAGHSVERTEADLKKLFAPETWNDLHLRIIYFGREHCPAQRHDPQRCPICSVIGRRSLFATPPAR